MAANDITFYYLDDKVAKWVGVWSAVVRREFEQIQTKTMEQTGSVKAFG